MATDRVHLQRKSILLVSTDVCRTNPCKNGGTCTAVPTGAGYICKCRLGYTGIKCEFGNASFNTILLVHYLSRWLQLHAWLLVCTHIKPCVISGFRYIRWVISLQLTPKPVWPVCVSFSLATFFCLQQQGVLIYSRLELKFSFSLKGFLKRLRASTIQSKLVKMCQSLAPHSPFFSAPQRACILLKLGQTMFIYSEFLEVSRVTQNIYRKIPKVSPGAYIFEGLIFGGAYLRMEICVSKSIGQAFQLEVSLPFLLCFTLYLRVISKYKLPGGLIFGGAI